MNSAEIISLNHSFERQACTPVEGKLSKWMDVRTVRQLSTKLPYLPCQTISLLNSNARLALMLFLFCFYFFNIFLLAMNKTTFSVAGPGNKKWQ